MSITSAFVLYSVIWAILFYIINPMWQTSQSEDGKVVPGTPASAPVDPKLRKKVTLTTVIATVLFAITFSTIEFSGFTLDDVRLFTFPSER
jgi:predicted secreted protein